MAQANMDRDALLASASTLQANGHAQRALETYLQLFDGAASLGLNIAQCYEALGRLIEARYWVTLAAKQQPDLPQLQEMIGRLGGENFDPESTPWGMDSWNSSGSAQEFDETQRLIATIPGGAELLKWFGGKASFGDAEVVRVDLDRENRSRLELVTSNHSSNIRVTFFLVDWIDANLSGFSSQNVIGDLILRQAPSRPLEAWERGVGAKPGEFEIEMVPIYGAYGTIRASISRIEFTEVYRRGGKTKRG
jgi:hypothetical protein